MKIVLINTRYAPEAEAGPAFAVQSLAESLVQGGHDVHVICLARDLEVSDVRRDGVVVHRLPPGTGPGRAGEMASRILEAERPDVAHTHWLSGFPFPGLGAIIKQTGVRLVHTLHEHRFLCRSGTMFRPGAGACRRLCLECAPTRRQGADFAGQVDAVIAVSRFTLEAHLRAGLFREADTTVVIGTGFAGPEQPVPLRESAAEGPLRLGYLGRISEEKGLLWLLRQLAGVGLAERLTVTIAGRPPEGLPGRWERALPGLDIRWLGFVPPRELMEQIDWLVAPSVCHDPFPRTVFEAFAFGIPVLGSRMGGIPEMIEHGVNGRLFDPATTGAVLNEIRWIDEHRDQWPDYRKAAWDSRTRFLPERIAAAHLPVYRGRGPQPAGLSPTS